MNGSGHGGPSPAKADVDGDLRARREQFLEEIAADYDADAFDSSELERLLAEARRLH